MAGNPRIQHERVEIGAYEHNASLTLLTEQLSESGSYLFNGQILTELGYYTTVYPMPDCDSVVGLTLTQHLGLDINNVETLQETSLQVFDLTGRPVRNDVDALAPGVYLLRFYDGNRYMIRKIVVK